MYKLLQIFRTKSKLIELSFGSLTNTMSSEQMPHRSSNSIRCILSTIPLPDEVIPYLKKKKTMLHELRMTYKVHEWITWFSSTSSWGLALDSLLFWRRDWTSDSTCKWSVNLNFSFNNAHCSSRRSFNRLNSWHVRSNLATVRSLNCRSSFSYSQILQFLKIIFNYLWMRYLLDASTSKFLLRVWVDVHVPVFPSWCAVVVGLDQ